MAKDVLINKKRTEDVLLPAPSAITQEQQAPTAAPSTLKVTNYADTGGSTPTTRELQAARAAGHLSEEEIAGYRSAGLLPPAEWDFYESDIDPTSGWNLASYGGAGWKHDIENGIPRAINNDAEYQAAYEAFIRKNGESLGLSNREIEDEIAGLSWNNGNVTPIERKISSGNDNIINNFPLYDGFSGAMPTYQDNAGARPTYQGYNGAMPTYQGNNGVMPTYQAGSFDSKYGDIIDQIAKDYMGRDAFSYDYTQDPLYKAYSDEYSRLGKRAMEDTTAKIAARTGGLASSYAATAGNQAYGNYMSELADKVPELYKLAYEMYNNEGNQMLDRLNMLRGLESDAYSRFSDDRNFGFNQYLAALEQYNADRNFDYSKYLNELSQYNADRDFDYSKYLNELSQYNTDRDFDYSKYLGELSQYNTDRNFEWNQYLAMLNQANLDREYSDRRSDADYQKRLDAATLLYQMTGDTSGLSDVYGLPDLYDANNTVYAYSNDGGEPYKISSAKGLNYLQTLPVGASVKGGDGSTWTKNADGTITISNNGKTWTYGTPTGGGSGGYIGSTKKPTISIDYDRRKANKKSNAGTPVDDTLDYDSIAALGYDINDPADGERLANDIMSGRIKRYQSGGKLTFVKAGSAR